MYCVFTNAVSPGVDSMVVVACCCCFFFSTNNFPHVCEFSACDYCNHCLVCAFAASSFRTSFRIQWISFIRINTYVSKAVEALLRPAVHGLRWNIIIIINAFCRLPFSLCADHMCVVDAHITINDRHHELALKQRFQKWWGATQYRRMSHTPSTMQTTLKCSKQ